MLPAVCRANPLARYASQEVLPCTPLKSQPTIINEARLFKNRAACTLIWKAVHKTKDFASGGVRYLFNDDYDVDASINGLYDQANVDLPSMYKYASASVIVSPNKNVDLAFTYAGIFDSMGHSHNAIANFHYNF